MENSSSICVPQYFYEDIPVPSDVLHTCNCLAEADSVSIPWQVEPLAAEAKMEESSDDDEQYMCERELELVRAGELAPAGASWRDLAHNIQHSTPIMLQQVCATRIPPPGVLTIATMLVLCALVCPALPMQHSCHGQRKGAIS